MGLKYYLNIEKYYGLELCTVLTVNEITVTGKFRTSNSCIPEHHALTKEVRMVRPNKGVSFRDERLAIAPGLGAPCVIFSTVPYSKTIRNAR